MAVLDYVTPSAPSILSRVGSAIWDWTIRFSEAHSRSAEVEHYNAMSDEELQGLGLSREDIVRHVFRDQMSF